MNDELIKAICFNDSARIYICSVKNIANTIGDNFSFFPSPLDALARVLSVGAMMAGKLKNDMRITIRVDGDGPVGKIIVEGNAKGEMAGYVENPHCHFEYNNLTLNVEDTVGRNGFISVIKDLNLNEPFTGTCNIIDGGIAKDFTHYLLASEQVNSCISLGSLVDESSRCLVAGGFMIELLPNAPEEEICRIEKVINSLDKMSNLLKIHELEDILKLIDPNSSILEKMPLSFKCHCSKERFSAGLLTLSKAELEDIIKNDKEIDTTCHFCNQSYHFNEGELKEILNRKEEK